jgi:large subunit ribosomal protein L30e
LANVIDEIRKIIKEKKDVIGTDNVMKNLKVGKLSKVYLTSNCPEGVKEDVKHYAGLSKTEVVQLSQPNDELGVVCKKLFAISMMGLRKGA